MLIIIFLYAACLLAYYCTSPTECTNSQRQLYLQHSDQTMINASLEIEEELTTFFQCAVNCLEEPNCSYVVIDTLSARCLLYQISSASVTLMSGLILYTAFQRVPRNVSS